MREFESSHSSQAVWQLEIVPSKIREMPANGGFSQFLTPSLVVKLGQSQSEIVDSLRLILEIFPFSGDFDWRLGSIYTARGRRTATDGHATFCEEEVPFIIVRRAPS
jgi:hypothetical protein